MTDFDKKLNSIENRLIELETEFRITRNYLKYLVIGVAGLFGINLQGIIQ